MENPKLLIDLQQKPELDPYTYDGSYEIGQELVRCYSKLDDFSKVTVADLNALYLSIIGTWKINIEKKKEKILLTCLPDSSKQHMINVFDSVWDNACTNIYSHISKHSPSIGMFGTGFMAFKTPDNNAAEFIKMCVEVFNAPNDEEALTIADKVLYKGVPGMRAASVSVILHILNPYLFPIINTNAGNGTIFEALGIEIDKPHDETKYISNTRLIKEFCDKHLPNINYRVLDVAAWDLDKYINDPYWPSLKDYDPKITTEQYLKLMKDTDTIPLYSWETPYLIYKYGGEATCKMLEKKFGNKQAHYNISSTHLAKKVYEATKCPLYDDKNSYWKILYRGKETDNKDEGSWIWRLREPLWQAIEILDAEDYFLGAFDEEKEETTMSVKHDLNTILYGPPGTGKTYHTVIYAVAIIENRSIDDISREPYDDVKVRFDDYKKNGQIVFTTFHQSYGYEEFIEGIKPDVDSSTNEITYKIIPGIFKNICTEAKKFNVEIHLDEDGLNGVFSSSVWTIHLDGTGNTDLKKYCFDEGSVRIGWNNYPQSMQEIESMPNVTAKTRCMLEYFQEDIKVGDIVVTCKNLKTIDAVGIVTGDYEFDTTNSEFPRKRAVKWLNTNLDIDVMPLNNDRQLPRFSVAGTNINGNELINLVLPNSSNLKAKTNNANYVIVIDEINRGNISKIFGELITLIEDTKRDGNTESTSVTLPYSGETFSIPSNVYILGTMNTADRSIALMDTALRRRFSFVEMMPDSNVLRDNNAFIIRDGNKVLDAAQMLDVINQRIEYLFDREHTIGHAFFMPLKNNPTVDQLAIIFKKKIIPLLQEYFYEDYEKIQLVLGDNKKSDAKYCFISSNKKTASSIFNGNPELDQVMNYSINNDALNYIESYIEITKGNLNT